MRLTAIKLSGFKSFVEPTTVKFPSNLMGIVGPNGCGKSNIIDAVRWVMGESSARQLRGESMSDVIFAGSSARKPVSTATVELVFDNADGRAGGEYASYNEISVKRQVSRDGQSAYFLNGTRCRRKDITDLFLGTGLGPRSYAIIEQGMISQIVEARPEELRGFLEEAAGISRYKERRRETENRIRHTRENLERLRDLREEVSKQLEKLNRQAKAAERYKTLKKRYRQDEARLIALRWRELQAKAEKEAQTLKEIENRLQEALSRQRAAEKELETLRQSQHQASELASKIQAELYEVAGEIARLEQAIEHQREIRQRQQAEYAETETQLNELKQHLVLDKAQVKETSELIAELSPQLEEARVAEQQAGERVEAAESALNQWQTRWQEHQNQASQARNRADMLRQRIEHLDDRMNRAAARLASLDQQSGDSAAKALADEKSAAEAALEQAETRLAEARESAETLRQGIEEQRGQIESLRNELEQARARRHERQGRLESLKVLNRKDDARSLRRWFNEQGLDPEARVLEAIEVRERRWTGAVETVLAAWLKAVRVEDSAGVLSLKLPKAGLLVADGREIGSRDGTLGSVVDGAGALRVLLNQVHMAEDLDKARQRLNTLGEGESVVTPEGVWLGVGWIRQPSDDQAEVGLLEREQEIRALGEQIESDTQSIAELETALGGARETLSEREAHARELDLASQERQRERAQAHGQLAGIRSRLETLERQRKAADEERRELSERQDADAGAVGQARSEMQEVLAAMETAEAGREPLREEKQRLDEARETARREQRQSREQRESLSIKLESSRAGLDSLRQSIARMDNQVGQLQSRYLELSEALAQGDEPVREQQAKRDGLLDQRLEIEKRLREARQQLENLEASWREQDQARQMAAADVETIRGEQSQRQLEQRETQLRSQSLRERIEELEENLEALLESLPEGAETSAYQQELERLEAKIRKLEPVNLAAIEEAESEAERKEYLDRQHADLEEALETLESAIAKIDRDSRTRFKETFEQINKNMESLFPRLFGGGHGHLEMVGDDWLTAGVAIMARPPGKRIARIHLMSGGEKALTAVAFVFSIFNLNPAPFCLLDEVDAPLDDANVGRFSEMVREMSEQVQFLIVTHNKVTMEVAHQMLGVTMRESGVSRLVSVDLDKAVALAEA
ncbi:chromosome segregation protein SMC [Wenzhouxiangella marina]|uniref:Chromosome partition protein Smc n=1 Tax=Wenzhouxiangella marina TaxID=1579979 RepID=A0A0K0XWD9_9GAMM|nr:chromosome segregation protein SMC [Wenzhouxiangella marina]AKS42019.1 Chromosome partition protein Smc [Wenzhouxiangella marina]MBB6086213.1 chromosome segregation protein [Wenzhouxiangella marina]